MTGKSDDGKGTTVGDGDSAIIEAHKGTDLWVDLKSGSDANDGHSVDEALRTIQRAADLAQPGTIVHILPGVYRETVRPSTSGSEYEPILYAAESGPGTVTVRGSEPASALVWVQLVENSIGLPSGVDPSDVYYTDLSSWELDSPPRFVVELDDAGEIVSRLSPSREPDWRVETEWKVHEFWWSADGGWAVAGCYPPTDADAHCDLPWRSYTQLTDTSDDSDPVGIEPGNLTSLGNIEGATLVALDAQHAHYSYRATVTSHDVSAGRVTVDEQCENDGTPGLGWGSKYYIENHPALMDRPGEWWYDVGTGLLYLWSPTGENPATLALEISRWDNGFDLTDRSYITLNGLTVELFNSDAYKIENRDPWSKAHGNVVRNVTFRYASYGVVLYQYVSGEAPSAYAVDGFLLEDSDIGFMDTAGIESTFWWPEAPAPELFHHAGVRNTVIRNNTLHHLGYNSSTRSAVGIRVFFPDRLRFEGNHVHHVAQNGVHFHLSLIDSSNVYGLNPEEIYLGEILLKDNLIERTCQLASDCGDLKLGGSQRPYTHVFRDVLIVGNVFRDTFGWSDVSARRLGALGDGNGLYVDYASGIHAYRNISYNHTGAGFKLSCLWRDGDIIYYNNIAANNYSEGFEFTGGGSSCDDHNGSVNTQLVNNILINNDAHGIDFSSAYDDSRFGNLTIDHNLYYNNGWNEKAAWNPADIQLFQGSRPTQYFHSLSEIRDGTSWEDRGVEGDPGFVDYSLADHDRYGGSWPDFHITANTSVLDRGTVELPRSLRSLLVRFGVVDVAFGSAYDIGRYEAPGVLGRPTAARIQPGGSTAFMLSSFPRDFPESLTLSADGVPPDLTLKLESALLGPGEVVSLMVTDTHEAGATLLPGLWYSVRLAATYGQLVQHTNLQVLVGGSGLWLPLVLRGML
jgi:hypothetical protein